MKLVHTLFSFLIPSHEKVQRIGIVAGMVWDGQCHMIYSGSLKKEGSTRLVQTHILLADTRKVHHLLDIIFVQQVLAADSRSNRSMSEPLSTTRILRLTFAILWANQMHQLTGRRDVKPSQRLLGHQSH